MNARSADRFDEYRTVPSSATSSARRERVWAVCIGLVERTDIAEKRVMKIEPK